MTDPTINDLLAAKDAEIAELRAQRNEASVLQLRTMRERDEARECVGRLWRSGTAILLAGSGNEDFGQLAAALDATPEHLR